jgi:hypothetical protein
VRIGIQNEIRHTRRAARVQRLLDTFRIERLANRLRANHRDWLSTRTWRWQETSRFAGGGYVELRRARVHLVMILKENR